MAKPGIPRKIDPTPKEDATMSATETSASTVPIDDAIGQLETVYRAVTGKEAPAADQTYAPIPAEKDPTRHVEEQMTRLPEAMSPKVPTCPPPPHRGARRFPS